MASQFNTQSGQTMANVANGLIGTGLTFVDGMAEMKRGNIQSVAAKQAILESKGSDELRAANLNALGTGG